jgi:hypothetical protein
MSPTGAGEVQRKGGRSVDIDLERCTAFSARLGEPANVKLLLKAFFADADTACMFMFMGGEIDLGRDWPTATESSKTSLSLLGLFTTKSSLGIAGKGTSPRTRLILRDFFTSFILSLAARSFVVVGTGIAWTGSGELGRLGLTSGV